MRTSAWLPRVTRSAWAAAAQRARLIEEELARLESASVTPDTANALLYGIASQQLTQAIPAARLLMRPEVGIADVHRLTPPPSPLPPSVAETVEIEAKYRGYIARARSQIARQEALEDKRVPEDVVYSEIHGLSTEASHKLARVRPATVAQAARVPGITPADVGVLLIHLRTRARSQ
jgi:tRNA uridine 5-carboxymethylaminomethyl modification enzyme